jgi:hypothetical protein
MIASDQALLPYRQNGRSPPDAVRRSLAKRPIAGGRPNVLKRIVSMMLAAVAAMADHIGDRIGEAKVGTARG